MLPLASAELAKFLIGTVLVRETGAEQLAGRIVETEAYLGAQDPASHAFRGRTARNGSMFLARGHAYVYLSYGLHFCMNVSSGRANVGEAVLIRALEPLEGVEAMARNRAVPPSGAPLSIASGPGKLTQALAIDRSLDGVDLCRRGPLWLARGGAPAGVAASPRIGISLARDTLLRFYEPGSPYVSGPRRRSP